jgi:hypothetical protein
VLSKVSSLLLKVSKNIRNCEVVFNFAKIIGEVTKWRSIITSRVD